MDLISIIIPYHKKRKYISSTLNSVLNQTYKNLEIIIIYDDTDRSDLNFIKKISKLKKNIKLIINKKNSGVAYSRNLGLKRSKGKFVAFIDSDDLWKKNKIEYQFHFMKKNNYLISHTNYEIIDTFNKKIGLMKIKKELDYQSLIHSCDIGLSTVMINAKIKKKIRFPNLITKEDYVVWLNISKKHKIYGLQKNLVFWRKNRNSVSYTIQKIKDAFTVYSKFQRFNLIKSFIFVVILSFNFIKKSFEQKYDF